MDYLKGLLFLLALVCIIGIEKTKYGCHNCSPGRFFFDAFNRESHDEGAVIIAFIGYGGRCIAGRVGHYRKSGRYGQDAVGGSDRIALFIRQPGKGEGASQTLDVNLISACSQGVLISVLQDIPGKLPVAL